MFLLAGLPKHGKLGVQQMSRELESLTDEELARRSRAGSVQAFEDLVYRYERRIYAFIRQHCPNECDARDLTQETFLNAYQGIAGFNPECAFAPWLFTIARHKCIDRRRSSNRAVETEVVPELADERSPDLLLAADDERQAIWRRAQNCLSPLQFQALWLRYAEEMDVAQVARVLGKTRIHTKVLLFRARQALCRDLGNGDPCARRTPENIEPSARAGRKHFLAAAQLATSGPKTLE